MKPTSESSTQEVLAGLVERVTFHNAENGFCVLRAKARGHRDLVTVVGHAAVISAGEWITASGEWINDRAHGQQFKARFLKTSAPSSIDGIEKYLGSGMIRGIGPAYAKKMIKAFGEKVFDVIEAEPDRLREVTGIGAVRAKRITDAWAEQKVVREIMVFLHSNGVGTARAVRIFKTYGADAVQVMTENPYRLARCREPSWLGLIDFGANPFLQRHHASAEQIDAGAAIHGTLEGLQFVDLSLSLPVAPRLGDSVSNGLQVLAYRLRETLHRVDPRRACICQPGVQPLRRSTAKYASKLHRQAPHCCKLGGPRFQRIDAGGLSGGHLAAGFNAKRRRGERRDRPTGHRIQRSHADRS